MSLIHLPLEAWLDNVSLAALSTKETLLCTFDLARNVIERGVPGDFVECGVFGGAQCAVMARAIMDLRISPLDCRRRVHLFDSFDGIPHPGEHDVDISDDQHAAFKLQTTCSLEDVKTHMREWGIPDELLVYHPGMFEDTVDAPLVKGGEALPIEISILRIDGDLYASTRVCLEHLLPLVSPGGFVIVDDFALAGARKAVLESSLIHGSPSQVAIFQVQPK